MYGEAIEQLFGGKAEIGGFSYWGREWWPQILGEQLHWHLHFPGSCSSRLLRVVLMEVSKDIKAEGQVLRGLPSPCTLWVTLEMRGDFRFFPLWLAFESRISSTSYLVLPSWVIGGEGGVPFEMGMRVV